jgi:hypothetical protein
MREAMGASHEDQGKHDQDKLLSASDRRPPRESLELGANHAETSRLSIARIQGSRDTKTGCRQALSSHDLTLLDGFASRLKHVSKKKQLPILI